MNLFMTCDIDQRSKVDVLRAELSDYGYREFFMPKNYGSGLTDLAIVLVCQRAELNLKRRVRYSRAAGSLSMDIQLDLMFMIDATMEARRQSLAEHILLDVPATIKKYRRYEIDLNGFIADLGVWVTSTGWLKASH